LHLCPLAIRRYRARLHSALADRIEILCFLRPPSVAEIAGNPGETSAEVRERVLEARARQEHRLGRGRCNADMTSLEASECSLSREADTLLEEVCARRRLSDRARNQVLRLARTLADLGADVQIEHNHVKEALGLRQGVGPDPVVPDEHD